MVFKAACDRGAGEHPGALLYAGTAKGGYYQPGIGADGCTGKARRDRGRQLPRRGIDRREPGHVRQGKSADGGHDYKIKGGIAMVKRMTLDEAVRKMSTHRILIGLTDGEKPEKATALTMLLEIAHKELARQEKESDTKC